MPSEFDVLCLAAKILPRLAMRNTKHGSGLGRSRWVRNDFGFPEARLDSTACIRPVAVKDAAQK